jgi:hypothetical protein
MEYAEEGNVVLQHVSSDLLSASIYHNIDKLYDHYHCNFLKHISSFSVTKMPDLKQAYFLT